MGILRVENIKNLNPPGKLYEHSSGAEVFSEGDSRRYLAEQHRILSEGLDYFIAISWGEGRDRFLDFFGYTGVKDNWKANPEVHGGVIKNGLFVTGGGITCGEGLIVLGREEECRLRTKDLEEYLSTTLDLDELNGAMER
jgi:hypothetical protein